MIRRDPSAVLRSACAVLRLKGPQRLVRSFSSQTHSHRNDYRDSHMVITFNNTAIYPVRWQYGAILGLVDEGHGSLTMLCQGRHSSERLIWLAVRYHPRTGYHCTTPHHACAHTEPSVQRLGEPDRETREVWRG